MLNQIAQPLGSASSLQSSRIDAEKLHQSSFPRTDQEHDTATTVLESEVIALFQASLTDTQPLLNASCMECTGYGDVQKDRR